MILSNESNRGAFSCQGLAGLHGGDRRNGLQNRRLDQFVLDSPFEDAPNSIDACVDDFA